MTSLTSSASSWFVVSASAGVSGAGFSSSTGCLEESHEEEGKMGEEDPRPGFLKPNLARKSCGERWIASGLEMSGIERAVGMRPVVWSSVGSRTSGFGWGWVSF